MLALALVSVVIYAFSASSNVHLKQRLFRNKIGELMNSLDFRNKTIFFISYFYPPAGGTGTPGTLRTVKFIKNIENAKVHVLTSKIEKYPPDLDLNFNYCIPVNGEIVHRCGGFDLFNILLGLRRKFRKLFAFTSTNISAETNNRFSCTVDTSSGKRKSFWVKIKDFVRDILYFPDEMNPWIAPAIWKGFRVSRRYNVDILFATGRPWSSFLVAYSVSILARKPFVLDFRDPWVGNPFHKSKGRFIDSLKAIFEKIIVSSASLVILNTNNVRNMYISRYNNQPTDKFIVLTNGYEKTFFENKENLENCKSNLDICHAGNIYGMQEPSKLLDAIQIVNSNYPDKNSRIRFFQLGDINLDYNLLDKYSDLHEKKQLFLFDGISYFDCIDFLLDKDILVTFLPGNTLQIPSKIYDYIALNKPIICIADKDSALWNLVEKNSFGYLFDSQDTDGLVNILSELLNKKKSNELFLHYINSSDFDIANITRHLVFRMLKVIEK